MIFFSQKFKAEFRSRVSDPVSTHFSCWLHFDCCCWSLEASPFALGECALYQGGKDVGKLWRAFKSYPGFVRGIGQEQERVGFHLPGWTSLPEKSFSGHTWNTGRRQRHLSLGYCGGEEGNPWEFHWRARMWGGWFGRSQDPWAAGCPTLQNHPQPPTQTEWKLPVFLPPPDGVCAVWKLTSDSQPRRSFTNWIPTLWFPFGVCECAGVCEWGIHTHYMPAYGSQRSMLGSIPQLPTCALRLGSRARLLR